MPRHRVTAALTILVLAAAPASALADGGGAGDQEYQDPLAAPTAPTPKKQKTGAATTTAPAAATAPAASTTPASSTAAPHTAATSAAELPRTGAPAGLIALSGATMIAAGLALRRRTAES